MGRAPIDGPFAWQHRIQRTRAPSWSPEPPLSPLIAPHVLPPRLRASQEALSLKDWNPPLLPNVEMDPLNSTLPPPPVSFYPGAWSSRPEHLPLTGDRIPISFRDHQINYRSPGTMTSSLERHGPYLVDSHTIRHVVGCPAHRSSLDLKVEGRSSSRPSSRIASRPGSRTMSRPTSRSASRSGSRSGHRSGYSSPGSDLR